MEHLGLEPSDPRPPESDSLEDPDINDAECEPQERL